MTSTDNVAQAAWDQAAYWWSALGRDVGELAEVRTLTVGASGSAVYQLHVGPSRRTGYGDFVLKVSSGQAVGERARREVNFYRALAVDVPVQLPALVASVENPDGIGLLLDSAGVPVNPHQCIRDRWEDLAVQLGALHHDRLSAAAAGWTWRKPEHPPAESDVAAAVETWTALGYGSQLTSVWARFDHLDAALTRLPACLLHGDWHLGNILLDPSDRLVWVDWQEAGLGRGPEDLALLWQRAEFDGHPPPREAMLAAYARTRGIPNDEILRRATNAAELMLVLLAWPPFLRGAPEPARARLLRRLDHLLDAWEK